MGIHESVPANADRVLAALEQETNERIETMTLLPPSANNDPPVTFGFAIETGDR